MPPTASSSKRPQASGDRERFASPSPFMEVEAENDELLKFDKLYEYRGNLEDFPDHYEPRPVRHAKKMGCIVRDFAYEADRLPPVKPVWTQQHQPIGPESQGQRIVTFVCPKTPEVYIATPTLTPNGSYIWANPEEEALAASQQQATQERVQLALAKLQAQFPEAAASTPPPAPKTPSPPVPSTSSKPSEPAHGPTTPLVMRVSVMIVSHSAKSKQKRRAVAPDSLPEPRASKRQRKSSMRPSDDELPAFGPRYPLRNRARAQAITTLPTTRVLRSHVRAPSSTVVRSTRTPRHLPTTPHSRPRRS